MTKIINDDFAEFYLDEEITVEIDLPNGEPMKYKGEQVSVKLFSPATDKYDKAMDALQREATKRLMRTVDKRNAKVTKEDPDSDIKFLIAITSSIVNFPYPGGIEAIYREPKLKYIAKQVREAVEDMGNAFRSGKPA